MIRDNENDTRTLQIQSGEGTARTVSTVTLHNENHITIQQEGDAENKLYVAIQLDKGGIVEIVNLEKPEGEEEGPRVTIAMRMVVQALIDEVRRLDIGDKTEN